MANLKVFRFEPAEVAAMEEQLKREDLSESADVHFRFALGKAFEDAGDYDRAWEYYHTGNQRQRPLVFHDPVGFEVAAREDRRSLQPRVPRAACRRGFRIGRADLHRRPAALGLDADRADPGEPQPGGGHARAVDARRHRGFDRPLPARPRGVSGSRPRAARPGLPRLRPAVHRRDADLPHDRQAPLHRQAAEQLLARRLRAPDPAEREDHQRAAPSARQPASATTSSSSARASTSPTT